MFLARCFCSQVSAVAISCVRVCCAFADDIVGIYRVEAAYLHFEYFRCSSSSSADALSRRSFFRPFAHFPPRCTLTSAHQLRVAIFIPFSASAAVLCLLMRSQRRVVIPKCNHVLARISKRPNRRSPPPSPFFNAQLITHAPAKFHRARTHTHTHVMRET